MAITFGGINTGLPPNLVDQLIEIEKLPIKSVEQKKEKSSTKLKLVTDLETKLRDINKNLKELAGAKGFQDIKLLSSDPSVIEGSVDPSLIQNGNWNIEVVKLASKAAAISNGFPDKNETEIGVGYFSFDTPDGEKEVYINNENNTLEGAAAAINSANIGMRASVINDKSDPDAPWRLICSADKVGGDNTVSYPTLYFLDGDQDFFFDKEKPADNGLVRIDGFDVEIPSNTIEDLVPGVSLRLKSAAPGKNIDLTVKEDGEVVTGKIKTFVESMNAALGFIQDQNKMNEKTDTSMTLGGDSLIRDVEHRLRNLVQTPLYGMTGEIRTLGQIGVQFNRNGTLEYNEEKFTSILTKRPDQVQAFFVGDGFSTGFIASTRRTVSGLLDGVFGPISNRKRGLTQQIEQADKRIESLERGIQSKEQNLRKKFANLEEKMSGMKQQGAYLAQRFGGSASNFNLGGQSGGGG